MTFDEGKSCIAVNRRGDATDSRSGYAIDATSVAPQPHPKHGRIRMIKRWEIVAYHLVNWVECPRAQSRLRRDTRKRGRCTSAFILLAMSRRNETCKPSSLPMVNPTPWYATNLTGAMLRRRQLIVNLLPWKSTNQRFGHDSTGVGGSGSPCMDLSRKRDRTEDSVFHGISAGPSRGHVDSLQSQTLSRLSLQRLHPEGALPQCAQDRGERGKTAEMRSYRATAR